MEPAGAEREDKDCVSSDGSIIYYFFIIFLLHEPSREHRKSKTITSTPQPSPPWEERKKGSWCPDLGWVRGGRGWPSSARSM